VNARGLDPEVLARRDARNATQRAWYARTHPGCRQLGARWRRGVDTQPAPAEPARPVRVSPGAVAAAVDVCGLDVVEAAGLLRVPVDRARALLALARRQQGGAS